MEEKRVDLFAKVQQKMVEKSRESFSNDYLSNSDRYSFRLRDYSLDEIDSIINSGSLAEQRKLSKNYFAKDGLYMRIISHYASLLKYAGLLSPIPGYGKQLSTEHIQKRYSAAVAYMEKVHVAEICNKIFLRVLTEGCYFGVLQKVSKNDFVLLDLPASSCASRFKDVYGRDIVEFDVSYFDGISCESAREEELSVFPREVSSFYRRYKKGKTGTSWMKIPVELGAYFSFYEDARPLFLNVIPATIQYDETVDTERERDLEEIRKIIVQKIPHLATDGTLVFEPDEALEMHRGAVDMMKGNKNLSVLTTYADVDSIVSKTSSDAVSNNLEKMLQNVYAEASVSAQIFSPTGSQALETSLRNDLAFVMVLANKISRFITDLVNSIFGNSNVTFKYTILPITYHNQSEYITDALKLAQMGYSLLLPSIAMGIGQYELSGVKELENDVLNLHEILIPLNSSFTQTTDEGGRPTKTVEEKKSTTVAKEESIDRQGG